MIVPDKKSPAAVAQFSHDFVKLVHNKTKIYGLGTRVMVYTGAWFWDPDAGGSSKCNDHPLWISGYGTSQPTVAKGWKKWTFWQYTDKASVPGISGGCDYSRFSGTKAELHTLVGLDNTPTPAPAPKPPTPAPDPKPPTPKPAPKPSSGARCKHGSPKNSCGSCHTSAGVPYESACGGTSHTAYCQKDPVECPHRSMQRNGSFALS